MHASVGATSEEGSTPRVRIAVIGAGGIGGYYGGLLARAGHQVDLLARGEHLDAIRQRGGIEIRESDGSTFVAPVSATDDPRALVGAPYAILAVKTYSLGDVGPVVRQVAEGGATILSLLNGVDIADRLMALGVPRPAILDGIAYVLTARTSPGVIVRSGPLRRIVLGERDGQLTPRVNTLAAMFRELGVTTDATAEILLELWRKLVGLATLASVCGLARRPIGAVRAASVGRSVIERSIREIVTVGRANGIPFSDEDIRRAIGALEALPDAARPSLLGDVERGGPTEIDALSGTIVRLGRTLGIDTPVHDVALAAISALQQPA